MSKPDTSCESLHPPQLFAGLKYLLVGKETENVYLPGSRVEINQTDEVLDTFCSFPLDSFFMVKASDESAIGKPLSSMLKVTAGAAGVGGTGLAVGTGILVGFGDGEGVGEETGMVIIVDRFSGEVVWERMREYPLITAESAATATIKIITGINAFRRFMKR